MSELKVSVITINYNNKDGLRKTIESVINQTYKNYEYIIIDGNSTDGSVDVIKEYEDKIDYWISEPDNGIYNAMNKGIKVARGEYLNFMNSGDCFYSNSVIESFVNENHIDDIILGINYSVIADKKIYSRGATDTISLYNLFRSSISHQASFIKRDLQTKYLYDESFKIVSDWKFWLTSLVINNCSFSTTNIVVANFDTNGIGSTNKTLNAKERKQVLKDLIPPRILVDYENMHSPIIQLLPKLNKTSGFHIFTYKIIKNMIFAYNFFRSNKI